MRFLYPIELEPYSVEDGGGIGVRFPDWDGAVTDGDDLAEALANARDCLEEMLAHRIARREPFPSASPADGRRTVGPGAQIGAKAALWAAMLQQGVSLNELARRLVQSSTLQVRRLLSPRHASRAELLDAALAALGKELVVELRDAA